MPQPFDQLPQSVLQLSRVARLGTHQVPALLVHPHWDAATGRVTQPAPVLVWMHGRTVNKELDPGRYLRLARAGVASCALDLPGHGERLDRDRQAPDRTLEVVAQMADELPAVVEALHNTGEHHGHRMAVGGMSAGGMAALVALTRPHTFAAALLESTTGSWEHQRHRAMFQPALAQQLNPIHRVEAWRDIPVLGLHSQKDEWVDVAGQRAFFSAIRARSSQPHHVVLHEFPETGAPHEHSGFGRVASLAKDLGTAFLAQHLLPDQSS